MFEGTDIETRSSLQEANVCFEQWKNNVEGSEEDQTPNGWTKLRGSFTILIMLLTIIAFNLNLCQMPCRMVVAQL